MRIGFIGGYGHHYLRGLKDQPEGTDRCEFAACGDGRDDAAARAWAQRVGIGNWFDDLDMLHAQFRPQIVSIGSIYGFNGDVAAAALERDLPVVSDKPVAATWAQLDRLRSLVEAKGRILLTEFDFRSRAEFRAARQAVAEGRIGEVALVTGQKSYRWGTRPGWYADRRSYGGTLLWIASHAIDAIPFVTGRRLVRVTGRGGNIARPDYGSMEDHVGAIFELEGGATGIVHADFLRPAAAATHGDDRVRVAGSRGMIEVRDGRCRITTSETGETDMTASVAVRPTCIELLEAAGGTPSELYSTRESIDTAAVLLTARDACDAGEWRSIGGK